MVAYALYFGKGGKMELQQKRQQLEFKKQQIAELTKQNQKLKAEVNSLKNDLEAIEERARTELGMIKDGEVFIQVIDAEKEREKDHSPNRWLRNWNTNQTNETEPCHY